VRLARIILGCVMAAAGLIAPPSTTWAQVRPTLDPNIPSYLPQELASGTLSMSVAEAIKPLVRAWITGMTLRHPQLKVSVVSEESGNGLAALLEHRAELAAMVRRLTAAEIAEFVREYGYEPSEVPVAADALAIYVHKDNPITGIALDELDAMFCHERQRGLPYDVDSWGLVGVMDEWFEAPVELYGRNGKSGIAYFFREEVCKDGTLLPKLADEYGSASMVEDLGANQYGIGFGAVGYGTSLVKPVPIASVKGGRYVEPTAQTTMDGSYPLRRNLYLYIAKPPKAPPTKPSTELVRYVLSRQGQQAAIDFGYFPIASAEITRLVSKWSISSKIAQAPTLDRRIVE
jgi:phosphate transport system substrate-binding protein